MCTGKGTSQNRKPTVVQIRAYTVVVTLNEVEAKALSIRRLTNFYK